MRATLDIPAPTHREVDEIRSCCRCGAYLRSYNETGYCAPCGIPKAERVEEADDADLIAAVAEISDSRRRQRAFEAIDELMRGHGIAA